MSLAQIGAVQVYDVHDYHLRRCAQAQSLNALRSCIEQRALLQARWGAVKLSLGESAGHEGTHVKARVRLGTGRSGAARYVGCGNCRPVQRCDGVCVTMPGVKL